MSVMLKTYTWKYNKNIKNTIDVKNIFIEVRNIKKEKKKNNLGEN